MERLNLSLPYNPSELAIHSLRYLPLRPAVTGKRVLDIACGEGVGTFDILRWGAAHVVGVDVSDAAISAAKDRLTENHQDKIKFVCDDAFSYLEKTRKTGKLFDIIVSVETVEHVQDPRRFLELCKSCLEPDGSIVVTCPNDHYYYGHGATMNRYHCASYGFEEFKELAEGVLGEGQWALGAPLQGFGVYPLKVAGLTARHYDDAFNRRRGLTGLSIAQPVRAQNALSPATSLFYMGVWGSLALNATFGVTIPYSSNHHMPDVSSVSSDIALGMSRRLAIVHGDDIDTDEIAALRESLARKYDVEAVLWEGNADALAGRLLEGRRFDNIHFESPDALETLAGWIGREAIAPTFADGKGAAWSRATLTARGGGHPELPPRLKALVDGMLGAAGEDRASEMAVLWSANAPKSLAPPGKTPAVPKRMGVILPRLGGRNAFDDIVVPAQAHGQLPKLSFEVIEPDATAEQMDKVISSTDILICFDDIGPSRRAAQQAIRLGHPVILSAKNPIAALLGDAQQDLVVQDFDVAGLQHALRAICRDPEAIARIRAENLLVADHMASAACTAAWTRTLARAQKARAQHGGALRDALMRITAQIATTMPRDALNALTRERDALRAECDGLRNQTIEHARLIAQLMEQLQKTVTDEDSDTSHTSSQTTRERGKKK